MAPITANGASKAGAAPVTPTEAMAIIAKERIVLAGNPNDSNFCKLKQVLEGQEEKIRFIDITKNAGEAAGLLRLVGRDSFPLAWVKGVCAGGLAEVTALDASGFVAEWLKPHDYDLVVIGGGSGGLAAAKEAASLGARVAVLDFVRPSPQGTTWGLGGTCVNVGCIPKKLMHQAAILGKSVKDAKTFGWQVPEKAEHSWTQMRDGVQRHIATLNWGYKVQLREQSVTYLNSYGSFVGSHSVKAVDKKGKEKVITADRFLVAVGLRPKYLEIPGAKEYAITSDDIFSLTYNPGKTLMVGASYISLECGGFLAGTGNDVTVMVRSILLRGFDLDMARRIGVHMEENAGVKFIRETVPTKIEELKAGTKEAPGLYKVTAKANDGSIITGEYNTVCMAVGRVALTDDLGLGLPSVRVEAKTKKIPVNKEQSSAPWVFAIGDVASVAESSLTELTPVAISAGKLLARRLFGQKDVHMNYLNTPTTVFTPLEYGCCGLSEEEALDKFGADDVEIFHNKYEPLEYAIPQRDQNHCYVKLICRISDDLRVLGLHITGPNAGEITQGFGLLLTMKARKADLDSLVGIHPTQAEVICSLTSTKRDGTELKTSGC